MDCNIPKFYLTHFENGDDVSAYFMLSRTKTHTLLSGRRQNTRAMTKTRLKRFIGAPFDFQGKLGLGEDFVVVVVLNHQMVKLFFKVAPGVKVIFLQNYLFPSGVRGGGIF